MKHTNATGINILHNNTNVSEISINFKSERPDMESNEINKEIVWWRLYTNTLKLDILNM